MKKQYKLIKTYPGSPTLGTIATEESPYYRYNGCCMCFMNIIEESPEFWEKINEPIFISDDGKEMLEGDKYFAVYSTWLCDAFNVSKSSPLNHTKNFSCRELAEKYIQENKPQYSKKEVIKILREFDLTINEYEGGDNDYASYIKK